MDVMQRIDDQVKNNPVVIYMKGTPQFPQCGFSATAAEILKRCGVKDFVAVNILLDDEIRSSALAALMRESAATWTQLALTFKAASESERFPLAELEAAITAVEHAEYRYAQAALQT